MVKWICLGIFLLGLLCLWFLPDIARQKTDRILNEIGDFSVVNAPINQLPTDFPMPPNYPLQVDPQLESDYPCILRSKTSRKEILQYIAISGSVTCDVYRNHLFFRSCDQSPGWGIIDRLGDPSWESMGTFRRKLAYYGIWTGNWK